MNNTIMIVDDIPANIDALAGHLGVKYTIIPAIGGERAIRLLPKKKPDLVLLDVLMPGLDGFDVLQFMKGQEELSKIPVIFVTTERDPDSEARGIALGAVDYLHKPFNAAVVNAKIQNHLALKAHQDNLEEMVQQRTKLLEENMRLLEERTRQLDASREAIIMGMSLMSDSHDKVTGAHIERIKEYTRVVAHKMTCLYPALLSPALARQIELFSPLHDVGKIAISDTILKKTGLLTPDEYEIMKTHTLEGASLLKKTTNFLADGYDGTDLNIAIEIAESHHEKYDGSGYPHGLAGDQIPLSARIVTIADVYDALRSPRPYKDALSHQTAVDIITHGDEKTSYRHFDPRVLEAFHEADEEIESVPLMPL